MKADDILAAGGRPLQGVLGFQLKRKELRVDALLLCYAHSSSPNSPLWDIGTPRDSSPQKIRGKGTWLSEMFGYDRRWLSESPSPSAE